MIRNVESQWLILLAFFLLVTHLRFEEERNLNQTAKWLFHYFKNIDGVSQSNNFLLVTGIQDHQAMVSNVLVESYAKIYSS